MRFQNEYDWCKENGFILVRLDISEAMQYNRGAEKGTYYHTSETGLDHIERDSWDVWLPEESSVAQRVSAVLQKAAQSEGIYQNGYFLATP
jgi:hypothetical protein